MKIRRRYNKTPSRRRIPGTGAQTYRGTRTPINVINFAVLLAVETVTFDGPTQYSGILPGWVDANGETVSAVEVISPTVVKLTFTDEPTLPITIPFEDPAFRNAAGGYVRTVTLPAEA
jgi:hypothetical protein